MAEFINVTTLNHLAGQVLAQCEPLSNLIVCGELSNFTRHYKSGHLYFSLKDENAAVKGVMFRNQARNLGFEPQSGMMVLAYGRATLYERDGSFQLYVDYMRPFGAGAAQMAFDALRKKLEAEGLFAPEHKKALPSIPNCIGVVTSKTGAALQDVQNVLRRRWPRVKLLLAPVSVQGAEAEKTIVAGIRALDADPRPDVILVTRGGGSKEDLWVFNSERIARAAYACKKPLVSGVGHEIDTTMLDYVADMRAPTPSAAAELCVPDRAELSKKIFILQDNIQKNMQNRLELCYNKYKIIGVQNAMRQVHQEMTRRHDALAAVTQSLHTAIHAEYSASRRQLQAGAALAASLSPYRVLARGYAMTRQPDGMVTTVAKLVPGQSFELLGDGAAADCTVNTVTNTQSQEGDRNI